MVPSSPQPSSPIALPRRLTIDGTGVGLGVVLTEEGGSRVVLPGPMTTVEIAGGGVLLAGGVNGVQASEDDGTTWQTTLDTRRIVDLEVNPFAPERVLALALEFTVPAPHDPGSPVIFRSADAGRTWTKLLDGSTDVEFVPGAPSSLYLLISTVDGKELRRSDDDGATSQLVQPSRRATG